MKYILFAVSTIFTLKSLAGSITGEDKIWDCSKYQTGTVAQYSSKNLGESVSYDYLKYVKPRIELKGQDEKGRLVRIDYIEYKLSSDINCQYIVNLEQSTLSGDESFNKYSTSVAYIFSSLCVELNGQIHLLKTPNISSTDHESLYRQVLHDNEGKVKWPINTNNNLGFIWQNSRCQNAAVDIFKQVSSSIKINALLDNHYYKIGQHSDYILFYANPGLVIKTDNPINCKWNSKCELSVKYKRQLKASIFDTNGKLHTHEDLEDRSDCDLKHVSKLNNKIESRLKYWACQLGLSL